MAISMYYRQFVCDFQNAVTNQESVNGILYASESYTAGTAYEDYLILSFKDSNFFNQDRETESLFSPCYSAPYISRVGTPVEVPYNIIQLPTPYNTLGDPQKWAEWYPEPPYFMYVSKLSPLSGASWYGQNWINPETDYAGWLELLHTSYQFWYDNDTGSRDISPPLSVNMYVFKLINLHFDGFDIADQYAVYFTEGNDPASTLYIP